MLAAGASSLARSVWPQARVTFQDFAPNEEGFAIGRKTAFEELTRRSLSKWLGGFDLILDTGAGDSFTDIYGLKRFAYMSLAQRRAESLNVPILFMPQTVGPFTNGLARRFAGQTLRRSAGLFVRDTESSDFANTIGIESTLTTDVVFALPRSVPSHTSDVIVNVSGLLWLENRHVDHVHYRASVHRLIEQLLSAGRDVTLMAHVLDNPSTDNDVPAVKAVAAEFQGKVQIHIPEDLDQARAAIAGANALVGSRMHACLNALSQGVPAYPWAYSRKFAPLLRDVGWTQFQDLRTTTDVVGPTLDFIQNAEAQAAEAAATTGRDKLTVVETAMREALL